MLRCRVCESAGEFYLGGQWQRCQNCDGAGWWDCGTKAPPRTPDGESGCDADDPSVVMESGTPRG